MGSPDTSHPTGSTEEGDGPVPRGQLRGPLASGCARSPTCRCSARSATRRRQGKVYFELRDERRRAAVLDVAQRLRQLGLERGGWRRRPGRRGRRLPTTTRAAHLLPLLLLPACAGLRVAGEGELLAQLERLRKQAGRRGPVRAPEAAPAPGAAAPIGVVTGEGGKARDDVLAGLRRRGWAGPAGVGVRPGAGPARRARDRPRAAGPGRRRRGRTRSSSRAAAARWPTCSRSATRRCAARSRCCACR